MKMMVIEVGDKEYSLGYPTRKDAKIAEENGLNIQNTDKLLVFTEKMFYTGLLAKQPEITEDEATVILGDYIDEGGDVEEITKFLVEQYMAFIKSPEVKKKKKAKIITM